MIDASAIYPNYDYGLSGYSSSHQYGGYIDPHLSLFLHGHKPQLPPDVIKITKTVAVKVPVPHPIYIPVPHPVKVEIPRPYPYPVEVQKIVTVREQVPIPVHTHATDYSHSVHAAQSATAIQPIQFAHQDAIIATAPVANGYSESNVEQQVAYGHITGSGYHS